MEINMGLPESSVRGFWITWAGFAVEASDDVAKARRGMRGACTKADFCVGIRLKNSRDRVDGARKSRYSDCEVAPNVTLLYALAG